MKVGAVDFLTKPVEEARLFAAIDQALERDFIARNERAIRRIIERRLECLTRRERQVMDQVICGRLNKQIASDLDIGEKTVKVHRARVMAKMDVRSVAELVQLASRVGLIQQMDHGPMVVARGIADHDLRCRMPVAAALHGSRYP